MSLGHQTTLAHTRRVCHVQPHRCTSTSAVASGLVASQHVRLRRGSLAVVCGMSGTQQAEGTRTIMTKNVPGDLPFPWTEKDPYKLPISIDRVQKLLYSFGWEKPWIEQIIDRVMKNMLKTTEERARAVVDFLSSLGLRREDEVCNMACISVVLLGLNPETRLRPIVEYLKQRGVPASAIPDLVLKHPRIFEYKVSADGKELYKGKARIKVDVLPAGPSGELVAGVNYYREGASFLVAPVSPVGPSPM